MTCSTLPDSRPCIAPQPALLRKHSRSHLALLGTIVIFHILLCIWFHQDRALFGDEWGTMDALAQPYGFLLKHFGDWRTMNFYLAGLKFIHDQLGGANWLLVLPGVLCGAWLVSLVAAIALRLGAGPRSALVAALLTAMNPWIVDYAVTIRSYIVLAALSAAMFLALLDWRLCGRWRDGWLCGLWGALALLIHLNAAYTFAAVAVLASGWTLGRLSAREPGAMARLLRLVIPCTLLIGAAVAAYLPMLPEIAVFREKWSSKPPTSLSYLPVAAGLFFGKGLLILPTLAAILYGSWRAIRDRSAAQFLLAMVIVPIAAISLTGVSHYPNAYARFLIAVVPMLILLLAYGIGTAQTRMGTAFAAVLLLTVAGAQTIALQDAQRRARAIPFHRIAAATAPAASARSVLVGPAVHGLGLQLYGVKLERSIVDVLGAAGPSEPICLSLIDLGDYTRGLPGVQLGQSRVVHVTGLPRDIAARLITLWQDRLRADPGLADAPRLAQELAALHRWSGDSAAAARYEEIARPPANPQQPRVR